MIYCFDLDLTLCTGESSNYRKAKPIFSRIAIVNGLYDRGHIIKIFTGRGVTTGIDWIAVTENQLLDWGVKYHELIMNVKPPADYYIDDRAVYTNDFFKDKINEERI